MMMMLFRASVLKFVVRRSFFVGSIVPKLTFILSSDFVQFDLHLLGGAVHTGGRQGRQNQQLECVHAASYDVLVVACVKRPTPHLKMPSAISTATLVMARL